MNIQETLAKTLFIANQLSNVGSDEIIWDETQWKLLLSIDRFLVFGCMRVKAIMFHLHFLANWADLFLCLAKCELSIRSWKNFSERESLERCGNGNGSVTDESDDTWLIALEWGRGSGERAFSFSPQSTTLNNTNLCLSHLFSRHTHLNQMATNYTTLNIHACFSWDIRKARRGFGEQTTTRVKTFFLLRMKTFSIDDEWKMSVIRHENNHRLALMRAQRTSLRNDTSLRRLGRLTAGKGFRARIEMVMKAVVEIFVP